MARPPATPEQKSQARLVIQNAAAELTAEGGVANVTVRKVAERAEVSVGAVYAHFESIGELMRSLWTPVIEEANHKLQTVADSVNDPCDRIRSILNEYVVLATSNELLHRTTLLYVRPPDAPLPERLPASAATFHGLLADAIAEGQASGQIIEGAVTPLAQMLWAGVHGALALPVNADIYMLEPAVPQAQLMIDTLMSALTPLSSAASGP